ncbi:hypothetical protein HK405_012756 [Cladochytrium tenue]|nr:hypothetical protein HK405_012756 [Cladochytrium tenue]
MRSGSSSTTELLSAAATASTAGAAPTASPATTLAAAVALSATTVSGATAARFALPHEEPHTSLRLSVRPTLHHLVPTPAETAPTNCRFSRRSIYW